jgi:cell division protein FtsB
VLRDWWPLPALVAAALLFAWIDGDAGIRAWRSLRSDRDEANGRIAALREDVETRRRDAAALEDDEFAIERAIRERLYARPDETIIKLHGYDSQVPHPIEPQGRPRKQPISLTR